MGADAMRKASALAAGICFAAGWWMLIDANVYINYLEANGAATADEVPVVFWFYVPGIVATLGLIMTNLADTEYLNPMSWVYDESVGTRVRLWLLVSFAISIGAVAAAIWLMAAIWVPASQKGASDWPGVAMTLQTALIFFSSLLLLSCKSMRSDEYSSF